MAVPVAERERIADTGASGPGGRAAPAAPITAATIAELLIAPAWASDTVAALLRRPGADDLAAMMGVMTGAARVLGDWWVADTCGFADVTLGLHRLTLLLFEVEALPGLRRARLHGGAVLLAPASGDQHGFGLATVATALRHAGWDVSVELSGDEGALLRRVASRPPDCIGLSVGHDRAVAPVRRLVDRLRGAGRASPPAVAVGGPMLARHPDLAARVGADFAAEDGFALAARLAETRLARAV